VLNKEAPVKIMLKDSLTATDQKKKLDSLKKKNVKWSQQTVGMQQARGSIFKMRIVTYYRVNC
jgi:hypothetical protein